MLGVRISHLIHTSSRAKACLNTLIMLLAPTKGRVRRLRIPTLATVSLRNTNPTFKLEFRQIEREYEPHAKELYRYFATEGSFKPNCQSVGPVARRFIQFVCKGDLLEIVFGQQAHLVHKVGERYFVTSEDGYYLV